MTVFANVVSSADFHLIENSSVALSPCTLLNGDLDWENIAFFVQGNDFPRASAQQIGLLSLLVAAQEGVMLHAEWWGHQHSHIFALKLWAGVAEHALCFLRKTLLLAPSLERLQ